MLGVGPSVRVRYLRHMRDGRIAYSLQRPNGVTELRFTSRR